MTLEFGDWNIGRKFCDPRATTKRKARSPGGLNEAAMSFVGGFANEIFEIIGILSGHYVVRWGVFQRGDHAGEELRHGAKNWWQRDGEFAHWCKAHVCKGKDLEEEKASLQKIVCTRVISDQWPWRHQRDVSTLYWASVLRFIFSCIP